MERGRMDGGCGRRLAVVVVAQNVLVAACLMVTLYVYWDVQRKAPVDEAVHIQADTLPDIIDNATLQFGHVYSRNMMGLDDEKPDTIYVNCTGPYVLYMDVCYNSLSGEKVTAILHLQVVRSEAPVCTFELQTSHEVCRGLQSIAYLRAREEASLHFYPNQGFKVKNMTMGLRYLLGSRCEF